MTFVLATVFWMLHQKTLRLIHRLDKATVFLSLAPMLFVSLLPYSTPLSGAISRTERHPLSTSGISSQSHFSSFASGPARILLPWIWKKFGNAGSSECGSAHWPLGACSAHS